MPTVAVKFRGADLEDAFVYRSSIYAWTFDQTLRIYAISDLEAVISRADPALGPAVTYWLFHSRGFGSTEMQRDLVHREQLVGDYSLELDLSAVPFREVNVSADAGSVMDMLIYYNTLYLASDGGLLAIDVSESIAIRESVPARRAVRAPCVSASGGLGAVAASCGRNGLHILFDAYNPDANMARKVSDLSLRAEIGSATVVNHLSRSELEFLSGDTVERPRVRGKILSEVRDSTVDPDSRRHIQGEGEYPPDFSLWDQARLVVFNQQGVKSVGVSRRNDLRGITRSRKLYEGAVSRRVLSACRVGSAFVVESPNSLTLAQPSQSPMEIATGPVIGLRSYQSSMRYLRLVTATSEQGLWLIALGPEVAKDEF